MATFPLLEDPGFTESPLGERPGVEPQQVGASNPTEALFQMMLQEAAQPGQIPAPKPTGVLDQLQGLLGGGTGSPLGDVGIGLLQSSGPSDRPVSFFGALGKSLGFAQERQQQRLETQLKLQQIEQQNQEFKLKQDKATREADEDKRRQERLSQIQESIMTMDLPENEKRMLSLLAVEAPQQVGAAIASSQLPKQETTPNAIRILQSMGIDPQSSEGREWIRLMEGPKSVTHINTGQKLQTSFATEHGKNIATDVATISSDANSASNSLTNLLQMRQILDAGLQTGWAQPVIQNLQQLATRLGIPTEVFGDPAKSEVFAALAAQQVFNTIGSLGVGISDADRQFIVTTTPNLMNTPQGNKLIIDYYMEQSKMALERDKAVSEALIKFGTDSESALHEVQKIIREYRNKPNEAVANYRLLQQVRQAQQGAQ